MSVVPKKVEPEDTTSIGGEIQGISDLIREHFAEISREYHKLLPDSYCKFIARNPNKSVGGQFGRLANQHALVIRQNFEQILNNTASMVSEYLHVYHVQPNKSVCQYKLVYFIGVAIRNALLQPSSEPEGGPINGVMHAKDIAKLHMYSMIGWLHYLNVSEEQGREVMSKALIELIDKGLFDGLPP